VICIRSTMPIFSRSFNMCWEEIFSKRFCGFYCKVDVSMIS
jgi:hypothetical protein